jgi:hypothetical protein
MTFIASRMQPVSTPRGARTCLSSERGPTVALASWLVFEKTATSCSRSSPSPRRSGRRSGPGTRSSGFTKNFADAAIMLHFSLVASGQIRLRKIDGRRKIASVLSQHTPVAA